MVALVLLGVAAVAVTAVLLYNKFGKKAEAEVKAEEVKLSDFAKNEVKKVDEEANDLHDKVKDVEAKVESDVKKAEAEVKKAL